MKRPPVEPLSRPAWDRIEAGVFARLDRGEHLIASIDSAPTFLHTRRWVMAGAFAAAASLALFWRFGVDEGVAPVADHSAAAPVARHETRIVSTDAPTQTTLGETVLTLAAHSDVNVAGSDADGWLVRLDAGQVDCQVAPRRGRPPFVVQAGETQVTVVGTRFSVARTGAEAHVNVTEGQVRVDSRQAHVLLGPGDSWPIGAAPPAAGELDEEDSVLDAPVEAGELDEPDMPRRSKAAPRSQQRFERAARLEAKDPAAALAIYQQLARGKGPWAANALYAQARLELERGRPQRAEPLLRRYLTRYPKGLNAADVRKQLERMEKTR